MSICLLLVIGSCGKREHEGNPEKEKVVADSLVRCATDSLFTNNSYARNILRGGMAQQSDSVAYYRLMAVYARACFASSDFDSVLYYNRRIIRFCDSAPVSPVVNDICSATHNLTGNVWSQRMQPDSAIACYEQAYQYRLLGDELSCLPDICINLADANHLRGNYAEDARYYRRALFLCDSLDLPDAKKQPIYCGLGQVYMELRDFELSNHYYEMAGKLLSGMTPYERWHYYTLRGNHFYYKKEYPRAEHYIGQSLRSLDAYPQMVFERHLSMVNQSELYMLNGKLDSAQLYLDQSYRYFSEFQNVSALYYIETQMIELALKQGDIARAGQMIARTNPSGYVDVNSINVRNQYLRHYFERTGDYKRAYEYQQQELKMNDSIRNERVRTRVAELDMRYKQDTIVMRRELLIARQSGEMKALRLTSYLWGIGCVALILISGLLYWLMKKKRLFLQQRHLNQIGRLRLENIRNHVSPHFTFNVLNREINQFKGSEEHRNGLANLVKILRKSLELTEKICVPLHEELDFVQTYLSLERGRLGEDFTLTVEVDEGLDTQQVLVPSMIIQIPVENAMKHGLAGVEGAQRLDISVVREGACGKEASRAGGIRLTITDNGRGYLPHAMSATRGTGTGLKVLYQTIQLLNTHNKGEKIHFEITNLADGQQTGTRVSVYVPCNYAYDL